MEHTLRGRLAPSEEEDAIRPISGGLGDGDVDCPIRLGYSLNSVRRFMMAGYHFDHWSCLSIVLNQEELVGNIGVALL